MATMHQRFGNNESGFSLGYDEANRVLKLHTWGFWDATLALTFERASTEACRANKPATLVVDVGQLKPQREEGQLAFTRLMGAAAGVGVARLLAVVGNNVLTKMQLMRLARQAGGAEWAFVATEAQAA